MDERVAACLAIVERCTAGALSPQMALMEMLIASEDIAVIEQVLDDQGPASHLQAQASLRALYQDNRLGCARIATQLRMEPLQTAGASAASSLAFVRTLFDGLVTQSEETSVALYSLGNPQILAAATREIVGYLQRERLLSPSTRVLDVGCGIGRIALALASHVHAIDGIDISEQMVAAARRRCAELGNVRIRSCTGLDLADFAADSHELVLAIDSFPYVVEAGPALVETMFQEAARVLTSGGHLVLLNFSYRGDLVRDREQVAELAREHGFVARVLGEQPFALWNGTAFVLRRNDRGV